MPKQQAAGVTRKPNPWAQLAIPLLALAALVIFNLIRDPRFFTVSLLVNNMGNTVLSGNLISIFHGASELAILAMGMTLVTAASGGQDISVGAAAAIAGSVFVKVLTSTSATLPMFILAFLAACCVALVFGAFNGSLVAVFKIQPMIATLILFTTGRDIAYWINGGASPSVDDPGGVLSAFGTFIPGVPVPTPIFWVVACGIIFAVVLKFTNIGLYTQAVGINQESARLNGISPIRTKLMAYMILGLCCAVAATIGVSRMGLINHRNFLAGVEMDAILAVAIGGNALSGGKFNMIGSVLGAYIIQGLTTTLYAMKVPPTDISAYKAVVIILLMLIGSPVVRRYAAKLWETVGKRRRVAAAGEGM